MLFDLDVSIKSKDLKRIAIQENFVEWGGMLCTQDPPVYNYNEILMFGIHPDNNYLKRYYGSMIDFDIDKYQTYRLTSDHLFELANTLNSKMDRLSFKEHELYKFLFELGNLKNFAIFLIRDEEEIDVKYQVHSKEELLEVFCNCLSWESPTGALITMKK